MTAATATRKSILAASDVEQTPAAILSAIEPVWTAWVERCRSYGLDYKRGSVSVLKLGDRILGWSMLSAPSGQVMGNYIFNAGNGKGVRLGSTSDSDRAFAFLRSQLTDRQRERLTTEVVS